MKTLGSRVWLVIGATAVLVAGAWLFAALFQGLLVILAGGLFGIFLTKLSMQVSERTRVNYRSAYAIVTVSLVAGVALVTYLSGNQIVTKSNELVEQFQQAQGDLVDQLASQAWWRDLLGTQLSEGKSPVPMALVKQATQFVAGTFGVLGGVLLVFILGFYFALQPETYRKGFLVLVPGGYRERMGDVIAQTTDALWRWMLGRLVGMAVITVGSTIGLWMIGIPLPLTLGILAGILTFIPNIGPILAAVPPLIFGWQQGGNSLWLVLGLYLGLQFLESYFLTPLITQHQVSLPPGLTLSAQLLFGILGGMLGLALASPIAVIGQVVLRELYVKDVLGEEPPKEQET